MCAKNNGKADTSNNVAFKTFSMTGKNGKRAFDAMAFKPTVTGEYSSTP